MAGIYEFDDRTPLTRLPFCGRSECALTLLLGCQKDSLPLLVEQQHVARSTGCENVINIAEYSQVRKSEIDAQLQVNESGRVLRLLGATKEGPIDVTEQKKQRLSVKFIMVWRAAKSFRRINSSQQ
jgi:hypothetical protein